MFDFLLVIIVGVGLLFAGAFILAGLLIAAFIAIINLIIPEPPTLKLELKEPNFLTKNDLGAARLRVVSALFFITVGGVLLVYSPPNPIGILPSMLGSLFLFLGVFRALVELVRYRNTKDASLIEREQIADWMKRLEPKEASYLKYIKYPNSVDEQWRELSSLEARNLIKNLKKDVERMEKQEDLTRLKNKAGFLQKQ